VAPMAAGGLRFAWLRFGRLLTRALAGTMGAVAARRTDLFIRLAPILLFLFGERPITVKRGAVLDRGHLDA